ncbi:D-galactonate dehydratase [Phyllosticta capitalensis]
MAPIKTIEHFRVAPRWLFVKVTDDAGNHGWGEATLEGHTEAVEGTLNEFAKRLIGFDADDIEHAWQYIWRLGFYRGGPVFMSALAGIDIALWDLKGRRTGLPIHQLLGGRVRNKVAVYAWIGGNRPNDVESAALARKAQGFKAVKMNATEDMGWLDSPAALDAAVERLRVVRSVGMDAAMDFHGRLHKPMAKQLASRLEPLGPLFIEEPLLSEHPEGIKQIAELTTCPVALGERLYSRWDVKRYLQDASVDILQPDVAHCGGISEIRKIAAMAEAYDVGIAPHCPLGPIALAACLQIGLCTPNHVIQEMSQGIHYNTESGDGSIDIHTYVRDASVFEVKDGFVDGLKGSGLGIVVDEERVRAEDRRAKEEGTTWGSGEFWGEDGGLREW